jgi:hypothetical protein
MRFIAINDGASWALNETACLPATSDSGGVTVFIMAHSATQNRMTGSASQRTVRAAVCNGPAPVSVLMRI